MELNLRDEMILSEAITLDDETLRNNKHINSQSNITKAVIVAAGNGSRLNGYQKNLPKPLVTVGGIPLLKRVILSAKKTGVTEFFVVIGYQAEKIKASISEEELGVKINWIYNHEWKRQNGVSALKAEEFVDDKFFLFMSDHVFDVNILKRIQKHELNGDSGVLCVDYDTDRVHDLEDATKVHTKNDRLINLSKELTAFNAIDIGIFVCTPHLFNALRESQAEGDESLSGGIRVLAREGKMSTFDIGDAFWQDVDTVSDIKYAEKLLLHSTRSKNDGIIAKTINRRISNRISKWLLKMSITPNQISFFNLFFSIFTAWILSAGKPLNTIIGGILFQLSSIIDGCDGEVAVIKHKDSKRGAMIDTITDQLSYIAFIIGVTVGTYRATQNELVFAITGGLILFLLFALKFGLQYIKKQDSGSLKDLNKAMASFNKKPGQVWYLKLISFLTPIGRRDMFSFLTFLIMLGGNIAVYYWLMTSSLLVMCIGILVSALYMLYKPGGFHPLRAIKRYAYLVWDSLTEPGISEMELQPEKEMNSEPAKPERHKL